MELEQRVKALEYEIKILKNEIQRTLLDIQEQILVHYYPALRSEESAPSDGTLQAIEAIRAKQEFSASALRTRASSEKSNAGRDQGNVERGRSASTGGCFPLCPSGGSGGHGQAFGMGER